MPKIVIETLISANIQVVFDNARSIDLHTKSASKSNEIAISGRVEGLICLGERTRWKAKHFGIWHQLEIEITEMTPPVSFTDEMIDGSFRKMKHVHEFQSINPNETLMRDIFEFTSPYGIIGTIVDKWILKKYMTSFIKSRNRFLKSKAEKK